MLKFVNKMKPTSHNLDILLISAILNTYKTTNSVSYGPVLHY